jgi:ABC-2 type transport system ATP-binding protein
MHSTGPIIDVRNVRRSFRSAKSEEGLKAGLKLLTKPEYTTHEALKGITFQIEPGSFIGLIGENGAGKTTLLKILAGLIPPTAGEARVLDFDPFKRPLDFRKSIALVMGQKAQLWWDLPAVHAFDLLRAIYEVPETAYRERLNRLAELLDVKRHLNTQIRRLSLGERMKMELIGAILHWPKVIFLDEPTIGLDVLAAHKLREFLLEFNRTERATIILTSHNMEDIQRLCPRILMLRHGELIYDGAPSKLTASGEQRLRVRLMQNPPLEELAQVAGLPTSAVELERAEDMNPEERGDGVPASEESRLVFFNVKHDQIVPTLQRLLAKYQLVDMGIEEQSLEKVIQRLYEGNPSAAETRRTLS